MHDRQDRDAHGDLHTGTVFVVVTHVVLDGFGEIQECCPLVLVDGLVGLLLNALTWLPPAGSESAARYMAGEDKTTRYLCDKLRKIGGMRPALEQQRYETGSCFYICDIHIVSAKLEIAGTEQLVSS